MKYFEWKFKYHMSGAKNLLETTIRDIEEENNIERLLRRTKDRIEDIEMSMMQMKNLIRNLEILKNRENAKTLDVKEALSILKHAYDDYEETWQDNWQENFETIVFDPENKEITISFRDGTYICFKVSEAHGYDGGFYGDMKKEVKQ